MSLLPKFLHEAIAKMMNTMFDNEGSDLKYEINPDASYGEFVEQGKHPHPLDDSKGYFHSGPVPMNQGIVGVDPASGEDVSVSKEMVMVEAAYLEHAGDIAVEHGRLKGFWNELASYMFEHWDMDGGTFQDMGVKHQLLTEVVYDPEGAHSGLYCDLAEPGDTIYINALQEDTDATTNDDD